MGDNRIGTERIRVHGFIGPHLKCHNFSIHKSSKPYKHIILPYTSVTVRFMKNYYKTSEITDGIRTRWLQYVRNSEGEYEIIDEEALAEALTFTTDRFTAPFVTSPKPGWPSVTVDLTGVVGKVMAHSLAENSDVVSYNLEVNLTPRDVKNAMRKSLRELTRGFCWATKEFRSQFFQEIMSKSTIIFPTTKKRFHWYGTEANPSGAE